MHGQCMDCNGTLNVMHGNGMRGNGVRGNGVRGSGSCVVVGHAW